MTVYFRPDKHAADRMQAELRADGVDVDRDRRKAIEAMVGTHLVQPAALDFADVSIRNALMVAQNHCCGLCAVHFQSTKRANITRDHVVPQSRRGSRSLGNILLAHAGCNNNKGNRWPTGCELIMLASVNARLAAIIPQRYSTEEKAERDRDRRRRKRHRAAARKLAARQQAFTESEPHEPS